MAEKYSYRPYQPGDESAINELYFKVTGRRRTAAQFAWQWLNAPQGQGDMWLIEATDDSGNVKLIGHHGVMPVAFSDGDTDLIFGKTENTMVLPEYRRKILYPRFEKKFIKIYSDRYDALFSTMGPAAAIRQRKAMGYEFPAEWRTDRCCASLYSEFLFIASTVKNKLFPGFSSNANYSVPFGKKEKSYRVLLRNGFLSSKEASNAGFFDEFWNQAKANFSVSPSRRKENLVWRFWENPYKDHLTLIIDERELRGYCVISLTPRHNLEVSLDDFCVQSNSTGEAEIIFNRLLRILERSGIYSLAVTSTTDSVLSSYGVTQAKAMVAQKILKKYRPEKPRLMPRKITPKGLKKSIENRGWDISGIVLEGRL